MSDDKIVALVREVVKSARAYQTVCIFEGSSEEKMAMARAVAAERALVDYVEALRRENCDLALKLQSAEIWINDAMQEQARKTGGQVVHIADGKILKEGGEENG